MTKHAFYEAIGHEAIDWEPYFLPLSQRPKWMESGGIEGLGNWQKPRRPRPHNRNAIHRAHEENREFPADSELETTGLKDDEYLQCMRLWIQLHYMTDKGRIPRQVPGSPPPYGPERIESEVAPAGSRRAQGRARPRGVQIVHDPVSGSKRVTTKTSIQTIYPSQQSRGLAHTTPGKIDGEPQSPKMPQRAPVTTPHVDGEGSDPGFGLAFPKPMGDKSQVLPLSTRAFPDLSFANAFDDALFVQNMWSAAPTPLRDSLELLPAPQSSGVTKTTSGTFPTCMARGTAHDLGSLPRSH